MFEKIKNWNLKRKIPKNQRNEKRWRYKGNGIDIEYLNDDQEVKAYNLARKRQKEKDDLEL